MTKKEIQDRLTRLGIDFPQNALKDDLIALLPKGEMQDEENIEAATEEEDQTNPTVANVHDASGTFIRAYSLTIHGDTFAQLASEFATAHGFSVQMGTVGGGPVEVIAALEPGTRANVQSADGQIVRTYSKEIHGDNFESLAHEFADPRGLSVVVL